ncbi:hypothetical protein EV702DRAFT_1204263 [Suillus placidus]|uniref:Uncharacterized protein n=1 Tax=Suillus placidus TaxID=48579 RepID=A0A9P6ZHA4_9AGAM|nr:hypothetical protein EV702DRAFT_1204263 [Suillus placidus]
MCLPQDTRKIVDRTIPTPSEWERLRMNASRARRLIEPDPDSYEALWKLRAPKLSVSGLVLWRLFEQFPPATLFPDLSLVRKGALPLEAYGLRQLSTSMDHGATAFVASFGKRQQAITNIQQARCLNTLKLILHGSSYDGGVMALELSSLEHLSLSGDVFLQCTHFIRQITTRQLSDVAIECPQPASPIEVTVFMESLSTPSVIAEAATSG